MNNKLSPLTFTAFLMIGLSLIFAFARTGFSQSIYFPPASVWEKRQPAQMKINAEKLKAAIDFVVANESKSPRDLVLAHFQTFGREPFGEPVGAFKTRGNPTGIIVRDGYLVAEWGEPDRVEMTFSVTKSFVSTVVGLALDRGLIKSLQDRAAGYDAPVLAYHPNQKFDDASAFGKSKFIELFDTEHNRKITWDSLLRQTSDWEGTLWGKPDWADRPDKDSSKWLNRTRNEPGAIYEYNDVRVNALALAALNVWRKPLPQILKENVMDEIGASNTWRWLGYENSFVIIDGQIMQSVSGGGHWGGGMFISARDLARFGLLSLNRGKWNKKQILSEEFFKQATTPTKAQPTYGFMNYFLNTDKKLYPNAPADSFAHVGNGTNIIYIDPEHNTVAVVRWIENDKINEFIGLLNQSFTDVK